MAFGNFGAWQSVFSVANNVFGQVMVILVVSIAIAFIFQKWFSNFLPGSPLVQGALFGFLLWAVFLILGGLLGFFKEAVYPAIALGQSLFLNLLLNLVWGATVSLSLNSKN